MLPLVAPWHTSKLEVDMTSASGSSNWVIS